MAENNQYFGQQLQDMMEGVDEESLVGRIAECETVLNSLANDQLWSIVIRDSQKWVEKLDANWQDVFDPIKLAPIRVLKHAYSHLAMLPAKYEQELEACRAELKSREDPDEQTGDYDDDTNLEN